MNSKCKQIPDHIIMETIVDAARQRAEGGDPRRRSNFECDVRTITGRNVTVQKFISIEKMCEHCVHRIKDEL